MRISTGSTADAVLAQLQRLAGRQADLQRQVATGQRVERPGDDPAAAGRVLAAGVEQGSIEQFSRNASTALAYSKTAYSGLEQMKKLSDRAGELAVLGQGVLDADARRAYAAEVDQLLEQAVSLGNTRHDGDHVFAGSAVDTRPFEFSRGADGRIASVSYAGDTARVAIPIAENATLRPGSDPAVNAGLAGFMNQLAGLRDALSAGDAPALGALRDGLAASEDLLVGGLSEQGAVQLRIEVVQAAQKSRLQELERQISTDVDADLPEVIVRLNQAGQAYEAALSSSSMVLKLSLLDYLR